MSSNFNNAKIINVYYNKGDRKPYDVNGKPIAYIGEEFVGSNEGSELRFFFGEDLDSATPMIITKRPDGETHLDLCEKVGIGANSYYKVVLNNWYAEVKGKLTLIFKVYNGTVTLDEGNTEILSASGQVIVSDIFNLEVGYAPLATSAVPPYDPDPEASWYFALSQKLDKAQSITVTGALPTLTGDVYDDRYFYVEDEGVGRLYYINGSTAIEVVFQVGTLKLTATGNGELTADTGKIAWDEGYGGFEYIQYRDVANHIGQDIEYYGKAVGTIAKGDVVQFADVQGNHYLIKKAVPAEINANPKLIMGIAKQGLTNNEFGYVAHFGRIRGIDTSGYSMGAFLWFSSASINNGELTITQPTAPNAKILMAVVVDVANNGIILVRPTIEPSLKELQDVHITSIANGQVLRWNGSNNRWENTSALTTAETDIDALEVRMTTEEGNVDSLESRMTSAEGDIDDIEDGTTIVPKALADQNGNVINTTYLTQGSASATYIPLSQKGANNGVVPLNADGKISSIYLSGEQDDFIEFADLASFPLVGEADIIYCAIDTGLIYRWTGSTYSVISPSLALGTTATTAYRGDLGQVAYDNASTALTNSTNIINGTQTLTDTRITNSAVGVSPLVVNGLTSTTANLQEWSVNNTLQTAISNNGNVQTKGIFNIVSANRAYVELTDNGTTILRNINNTEPALRVRKQQGTGNILELQVGSSDKKLEVDVNGWLYQNGTRLFTQTGSPTTNNFIGLNSGGTGTTGAFNTSVGSISMQTITTGIINTAVGYASLNALTTGSANVSIGADSGRSLTTGANNTFVGVNAGFNASQLATATNSTALGNSAYTDKSNQMVFGNASVSEILLSRKVDGIKVGIGTTTPSLLSFGNEFTISGSGFVGQQVALLNIQGTTTTDSNIGALSFFNSTTRISSIGGARSGADNSGRLVFNTTNAGSLTEKMTILPNGNVGIGTGSPGYRLDVAGGDIRVQNGGNVAGASGAINFNANPGFLPMAQIKGSLGFAGSPSGVGQDQGSLLFLIRNTTGNNEPFTERMIIRYDGNVGIGTSSPASPLHILRTTNSSVLIESSGSTSVAEVGFKNNISRTFALGIGGGSETTYNVANKLYVYNSNTNSMNLIINESGLVGINETSPTAQLVVKSGATNRVPLIVDTLASQTAFLTRWNVNGSFLTGIDRDGFFSTPGVYNNSSSNNSIIFLGGNGTLIQRNIADTNPALIVNLANAGATGNIQVWQRAGVAQAWIENNGGGNFLNIVNVRNTALTKRVMMYFDDGLDSGIVRSIQDGVAFKNTLINPDAGNVGIGTTTPSVRLEVNGIAKFDGTPSNEQTGDYTLVLADKGKVLRANSSSNRTITIPLNSSVAFPIDTEIAILRYGTGTVSISPTSGVTLNSKNSERKISGQYGSVALKKIGTDEWVLVGSLEA